jgi:hypothetical protein
MMTVGVDTDSTDRASLVMATVVAHTAPDVHSGPFDLSW